MAIAGGGIVWRALTPPAARPAAHRRTDPRRGEPTAPAPAAGRADAPDPRGPLLSREDVVDKALNGVVMIHYAVGTSIVQGSGFLVTDNLIVTNRHVIEAADATVDVELSADHSDRATARVSRCLSKADLALLELPASAEGHTPLALADVSSIRAGEEVVAVGSPKGLMGTVTRGIVSAMRTDGDIVVIQTDAAINPGNSGGPLLDMRGAVIGVNTLKYRGGDVQSIGFAVAANHVKDLLEGREAADPCAATSSRPGADVAAPRQPQPPPSIASVSIAPSLTTLAAGETAALELHATFTDRTAGTIRPNLVNWATDNPRVVTVTPSGSATAIGVGRGTITGAIAGQPEWQAALELRVVAR